MRGKIKIAFIGLEPFTLLTLLKESRFDVVGVVRINEFFSITFNPANLLFQLIYFLRLNNRLRMLERAALCLFKTLGFFTTSFFKRYKDYLCEISKRRICIFDLPPGCVDSKELKKNQVSIIVVNCWEIISEGIIKIPKLGIINIHPSKLPQYRGAVPTLWALKNGDSESAVSYILMDNSMDGGKLLHQSPFEILESDDAISLEEKINTIINSGLNDIILDYVGGKIIPIQQSKENVSKTAKYYEYMKVDFERESAKDICNKINLYPFLEPGVYCYAYVGNKKFFFKTAEFISGALICKDAKLGKKKVGVRKVLFQKEGGVIKCRRVLFKYA